MEPEELANYQRVARAIPNTSPYAHMLKTLVREIDTLTATIAELRGSADELETK